MLRNKGLKKLVELSDLRARQRIALRRFSDTFAKLYFIATEVDTCYLYTKEVIEASKKLVSMLEEDERRFFQEIIEHANQILTLLDAWRKRREVDGL